LNRHLDEATTKVLNLGREDLQILMREVRETLAEKDIELVLLIEDFAKLQGIDQQVLEAVLARPQQPPGSKQLCAIRTALACTTGYFQSLIDTVKQRLTFSVNLDVGAVAEQSLITQQDIQTFVARYLNVVRLEDKVIRDWADSQNEPLVSACSVCQHQEACHAGFASVDGIGLYPFTSKALEQMERRVNTGNFNPRILIKDVLKYTLENGLDDIKTGRFPSVSLREHFAKRRLSAMIQGDIKAKDGQNYERREILIDLWTDSNEVCDLPFQVHTAFNLPPLGVKISQTPPASNQLKNPKKELLTEDKSKNQYKTETEVSQENLVSEIPDVLMKKLNILNGWNNQEILPQDVGKDLREFIFPAIVQRIEWDSEMLLEKVFASNTSKYFKQSNVRVYSPKVTRETIAGIKLSLPINPENADEFRDTAIAFQGILLYKHHKNWKFKDGDRYFRTYAHQLEKWCEYVLEAIRRYPRESGEAWNPVPAAVELLAISATMAGHSTNSLDNLINSLFLEVENSDDENRASSWKNLSKTFKKYHQDLLDIVRSRIACTKGGSIQFQIIDAVQIIEPLKEVRKNWQPQCEIPEDICEHFIAIHKTRKQVDELLAKAIEEECQRQLNIYQHLASELGEDVTKKEAIDILKAAMEAAQDAGVYRGGKNSEEMKNTIEQFRSRTAMTKYQETMKRIQGEKENSESDSGKILQYLTEDYQKVITNASEFLRNADNFLDASTYEVNTRIETLQQSGGATVESSHQEIRDGLANLRNLMNQIKGDIT
jgi:hypothetical protein